MAAQKQISPGQQAARFRQDLEQNEKEVQVAAEGMAALREDHSRIAGELKDANATVLILNSQLRDAKTRLGNALDQQGNLQGRGNLLRGKLLELEGK